MTTPQVIEQEKLLALLHDEGSVTFHVAIGTPQHAAAYSLMLLGIATVDAEPTDEWGWDYVLTVALKQSEPDVPSLLLFDHTIREARLDTGKVFISSFECDNNSFWRSPEHHFLMSQLKRDARVDSLGLDLRPAVITEEIIG